MKATTGRPSLPVAGTLYDVLDAGTRAHIAAEHAHYRFTTQEVRLLCQHARDLQMWGEAPLASWWQAQTVDAALPSKQRKRRYLAALEAHVATLRSEPTRYQDGASRTPERAPVQIEQVASDREMFGDCPVRSERTLCCNLKTIDAVTNCGFGCSYCTIQTFYGERVAVDAELGGKLRRLRLDPSRFHHVGTGQSSDSLLWGNTGGMLDDLMAFAADNRNVLLELKTKSANVTYFLDRPIPPNVVCSWSLNTDPVIENEEHFTAPLRRRLGAARRVADRGIGVSFHFHPMVHYDHWRGDYLAVADEVMSTFSPDEVQFISFGSVTFIKPVMKQIRRRGEPTRILQSDLVPDPHGKLTYSDDRKVEMFAAMYDRFQPWQKDVFMYLCMEKAEIWDRAFGWRYGSNEQFEQSMAAATRGWTTGGEGLNG